jgi:hypothetical protein
MFLDHAPDIHDDDDYIRMWAWEHCAKLPIVYVPLFNIIPNGPDLAEVHWQDKGHPVIRRKEHLFVGGLSYLEK